ncbi:MAG: carboxypeptidase regulatory-like domain-containing protein [Flavobacteriales bacterium]|nr:carboxypeptidase regulatory-like domain-containing protein [Flavobacteriales bacterium]
MRPWSIVLIVLLVLISLPSQALQLRVEGSVTSYLDRRPMTGARVRVYKDGQQVLQCSTSANGGYAVKLDNQARYTIRVDAPGFQGKCYIIDTRGPEWMNDRGVKDLLVETRLPVQKAGMDLSWFDLPMGMARFTPSTGLISWNVGYSEDARSGAREVMQQYCLAAGIPYVPEAGEGLQVLVSRSGRKEL